MEKFWMIWVEGKGAPCVKHPNTTSAFNEAERLARLEPGRTVFILEATDCCQVGNLFWKKLCIGRLADG